MPNLQEAIEFIKRIKMADASLGKQGIQAAYIARLGPQRFRSVYAGNGYAVRFSEARTGAFSNTVLSLSALQTGAGSAVVLFTAIAVREAHRPPEHDQNAVISIDDVPSSYLSSSSLNPYFSFAIFMNARSLTRERTIS